LSETEPPMIDLFESLLQSMPVTINNDFTCNGIGRKSDATPEVRTPMIMNGLDFAELLQTAF
jgi:hypothetical protein